MPLVFKLPDLAEGTTEAQIIDWKVAVGEVVEIDQDIVEVETAKAVVVIPSPTAGIVSQLHGEQGEVMEVGKPLITFEIEGDSQDSDSGDRPVPNLVGYGPSEGGSRRRRRAAVDPADQQAAPTVTAKPLTKPPVRKLAKSLGIDLATIIGTGPGGVITREDVESVGTTPAPVTPTPVTTTPRPDSTVTSTPVSGIRRTIAKKMELAHAIPTAAAWLEADATGLLRLRDSLRRSHPDAGITPMAIILFLTTRALGHVPVLNSHYVDDAIVSFDEIRLGFAASTDRGLLVPVISEAGTRSIVELAGELRRLSGAARNGTIKPTELTGSSFTISNYGSLGMDGGIPMMNHPETGILGVGSITDKAVVENGTVVVRPIVNLSLSFDHRVCDGAEAAEFLTFLAQAVADPAVLLL